MKKKFFEYSIGLDIGTNSVGYAVIDNDYKVVRDKGKSEWGAYLFDDANTSEKTRTFRSTRRRLARRRERIVLLQDLMASTVLGVDDSFFIRLKDSFLLNKSIDQEFGRSYHYNLFNGEFTDKDYYKKYKTIYHLRYDLVNSTEKADPRLIYLALHHMVKYRGNFLYEGQDIDISSRNIAEQLQEFFVELCDDDFSVSYVGKCQTIVDILQDRNIYRSIKKEKIIALFKDDKDASAFVKNFAAALIGYKTSISELFVLAEPIMNENDKTLSFSFEDTDYEEKEDKYLSELGDKAGLLEKLRRIYMTILFGELLDGKDYISEAMEAKYDKHAVDLRTLKRLFKANAYTEYPSMFNAPKGNNYVNYVGARTSNTQASNDKKIADVDFFKELNKVITAMPDSEDKTYCLSEIAKENFLPKLNDVKNGAIPYQMNEKEMRKILDNQGQYYPELKENKDKILSILTFRRPYYVGTLKGAFSWNTDQNGDICEIKERVTPWNFYDLVDTEKLEGKFIERMLNHCQFFPDEECLPSNSIIYQSYVCLNELNKIKLKKEPLTVEQKKDIFINLMCVKKIVSVKDLQKYLLRAQDIHVNVEEIQGLAEDRFLGSMSTLIDFRTKLGLDFDIKNIADYEAIIRCLTIFDDKKIRIKTIKKYKSIPSSLCQSIACLRYAKWGRFSDKLLTKVLGKNGKSILATMYDSNLHFNEVIFDDNLGFKEQLATEEEVITSFDYERDIEPLYCSPSVKKGIWNALKIVEELEKFNGYPPTRIFIESTMGEEEKKKTDSRLTKLDELYAKISGDEGYFNDACVDKIKELKKANTKIDNDKLYLWLIQLGRNMYTGEIIPFESLDKCEIDHIVPRAYIKDDSFENRVLVDRIDNQNKSDTLALSQAIRAKMLGFWKFLSDKKLIGAKKFANLTKAEYSSDDCVGFVNRQLVETSQIVKEVKNILMKKYRQATIQLVKARMNSEFRKKYMQKNCAGFFKIRELNNFHHAKDAYLTAVLGQFTTIAYPLWGQDERNGKLKYYMANLDKAHDSFDELCNKRYGIVLDMMEKGSLDNFDVDDQGEYLWNNTKYNNVLDSMAKNDCNIVKKKIGMANHEFYNQTVDKAGDSDKLIPLRNVNGAPLPTKYYGGYSGENAGYFAVIKKVVDSKKKIEYSFIKIPVQACYMAKKDSSYIDKYIKKTKGEKAKIIRNIYKNQLIKMDGQYCWITGDKEVNSACEIYVKAKYEKMLYLIVNDRVNVIKREEEKYIPLLDEFVIDHIWILEHYFPLYTNVLDKAKKLLSSSYRLLTIEQKSKFALFLIKITKAGSKQLKLDAELGGGSSLGRLNEKTIKPTEVEWIDKSCTGLYETTSKGVDAWDGEK